MSNYPDGVTDRDIDKHFASEYTKPFEYEFTYNENDKIKTHTYRFEKVEQLIYTINLYRDKRIPILKMKRVKEAV
jgi:hypothetical protein